MLSDECNAMTCSNVVDQIIPVSNYNLSSCSTRCCSGNLCNAPLIVNATTVANATFSEHAVDTNECSGTNLYFLPGCTFMEFHNRAWMCSTLILNDFPYSDSDICR